MNNEKKSCALVFEGPPSASMLWNQAVVKRLELLQMHKEVNENIFRTFSDASWAFVRDLPRHCDIGRVLAALDRMREAMVIAMESIEMKKPGVTE